MAEVTYQSPKITVLGDITDMTLGAKPGIYYDFPGAGRRVSIPPPRSHPGTIS